MAQALNLNDVQTVKRLIERDLLVIASGLTSAEFDKLGWDVRNGIENELSDFQYHANESIARAYQPGKHLNSELGKAIERKLKVEPVWTRVKDNIRNYREKEPFQTIGVSSDGVLNTPHTQFLMERMAAAFGNQIVRNAIFGERDTTSANPSPYSLYDGLFKHVVDDMSAATPLISEGLGNLQGYSAITFDGSDASKVAAYELFDKYMLALDEDLAEAEKLNVAVSTTMFRYITQGAALKFGSNVQQVVMQTNNGVNFFDRKNVELIPSRLMGHGQTILGYTPGAIQFGSDLTANGGADSAMIDIDKSPEDFNELIYQMTVCVGTCLRHFDSTHFCIAGVKTVTSGTANYSFNTAKSLTEGVQTTSDDNGEKIADLDSRVTTLEG